MKTIKPQKLGVLSRAFENGDANYFVVSVLMFFPFESPSLPLAEVDLWRFTALELGDEPIDAGMPKQCGEVLVTGSAFPLGGPRSVCAPRVVLGTVDKTLYVVGDRFWRRGVASDPIPFAEMPLRWERAFGGEGYPSNPVGKGRSVVHSEQGDIQPLPNIEDPKHLIRKPSEQPPPAGFGAYDFTWPQRFAKAGTYDASWLKERFPGFAKDMDWRIWNTASEDQQVAGYFRGDETFVVEYMHPDKARIEGRLPGLSVRALVTEKATSGDGLREVPMRLDTVRLFPRAERGVLIFRGMLEVAEDDAADVLHLVVGCEELGEPKPIQHYRDVLAQRLDKKTGALSSLQDCDLLPMRAAGGEGLATAADDTAEMLATEGLLRKNQRKRLELEHEKAKQRMRALGQDPAAVAPLPPEEPPPPLDRLPDLVERLNDEAEKAKADAAVKKAEAEQRARAVCAAQGIDYDRMTAEAQAQAGGPPKFSAAAELAKLKDTLRRAKAAGANTSEVDALLSDPGLAERLGAMERRLVDAYRRGAHALPAAARLGAVQAAEVRAFVAEGHRAGKSFAGCDLTGADLSGLDLTNGDFKDALLECVDLSGAQLGGADFTGAVLTRADLSRANLFAAKLAGANLGSAKLNDAEVGGGVDLTGAVLVKAILSGARLCDAKMDRADLSEAVFVGADLTRSKAHQVNFIKADLRGIKLAGADLTKCNFIESIVAGVDFTSAKLVSAVFVTAQGDGAIFRDADLENLRLVQESSFQGADFRGARLDRANLRGTKLGRADFTKASLQSADLSECDLSGSTFYRATAKGAQFVRANLAGAVMSSMNLMEGSLQKANIHGADLRGANLFRVDFAKTRADAATNLKDANVKRVRIVPPKRGSNGPQ